MVDYWTFDGTIVDGLTSPIFDRTLGKSYPVGMNFHPAGRATSHTDRYLAVRDYAKYAGTSITGRVDGGGVYYREDLDPAAPVSSLVVPIEPSPSDVGGPFEGIWGLVEGYSDPNRLRNTFDLEVDLAYLGDASEYADRSAVETALTDSVI